MKEKNIKINANRVSLRDKKIKILFRIIVLIFFFFLFIYLFIGLTYNGGRFTISLIPQKSLESGLYMFENSETKAAKLKLYTENIDFMDNISINWLPENIGDMAEGSHNGENYLAHTFYIENRGSKIINYWYQFKIENVIKSVDEAIRVMIIHNGNKTVYAKINGQTNEPEPNTVKFNSKELAVLETRKNMTPNTVDKFTIVIWLEGDDPDCDDSIIGGEIKANFEIIEEQSVKEE